MVITAEKNFQISSASKLFFEEHGYLVIDNAFPAEDLLAFKSILQKALSIQLQKASINHPDIVGMIEQSVEIDQAIKVLRYADPMYVSSMQLTISRSPEFFRLTSSPVAARIARNLLGLRDDGLLYEISNGVVFTTPKDEENKHDSNLNLTWHRDTFYTVPRSRFLQMWGPLLHDSTEEIGTIQLCPGSHKNKMCAERFNPDANYNHRYSVDPKEVSLYQQKSISLKLGQLLLFDGRMIHASGVNNSEKIRCSILGFFHNAETEAFTPTAVEYKYITQTPEAYFYEIFGDERIKPIINEQAACPTHFD